MPTLLSALLAVALFAPGSTSMAIANPPPRVASSDPIIITVDDGPDSTWTPRLLDILAWKHVRAVFCLTGAHAQANPAIVRRIVAEGHVLCNHSMTHPHMLTLAAPDQRLQVDQAKAAIIAASGGVAPTYFRAPYGQSDAGLDNYALAARGEIALGWNAEGSDWSPGIAPATVERLWLADLAADPPIQHATVHRTPAGVRVLLVHDDEGTLPANAAVNRWPGLTALVSIIDNNVIGDPSLL